MCLKIVFLLLGWLDFNADVFGEVDRLRRLICYLKCFVTNGYVTGGILSL